MARDRSGRLGDPTASCRRADAGHRRLRREVGLLPVCHRRFDPRRVLTHVGSQRCYQKSGRSEADGWVAVPDRWTDVFGAWHIHHRSLRYSYRSHRNRYWVQSPFAGVDLETVLAAITGWRQRHGGRWSTATEAVMGLSEAEVLRLVSPEEVAA